MAAKPKAIFTAQVIVSGLLCACGAPLERLPGGVYVCRASGCQWEGKELHAVIMPAAAMYEKIS